MRTYPNSRIRIRGQSSRDNRRDRDDRPEREPADGDGRDVERGVDHVITEEMTHGLATMTAHT